MKKRKITYGVSGMMEFQAVIKVGRNNMKVLFTDGSMNAMGVNPAKFTTTNYMVQHAIENSPEFKRGLIKRISVIDLDENVQIEHYTQPAAPAPEPTPATESDNAPTAEPAPEQTAEADDDDADAEAESEIAEAPEAEQEDTEAGEAPEAKADLPRVEVEFAINDDAKDYLEQNYGAVRSKLRTRSDILAFAEAHNIDIKFV
jgi:hypothetical protein